MVNEDELMQNQLMLNQANTGQPLLSQMLAAQQQDASIASMRWESDPLVVSLRVRLGAYTVVAEGETGQTQLIRPPNAQPMVNDVGIDRFVALISGVVNPVTSLTNIDDEEANTLINQVLKALVSEIVYNQERFEIHKGDMRSIMSIMKSLVFTQFKRSVSGHESKNYRTQTVESHMQQSMMAQQSKKPSMFNPMSWRS